MKSTRGTKITKWLLLILIVLIFVGGGLYYWDKFYREPVETPTPTPSQSPASSPSPLISTAPTPIDWRIYQNQTYGFQVTFTDEWQGYIVDIKRATDPYANAYLAVWVPSKDPASQNTEKPGYLNPVVMVVYTQSGWDEQQGVEGPKPSIIGRSGNYIVGYNMWQDCPVSDTNFCNNLNNSWRNNIVPSFKAL